MGQLESKLGAPEVAPADILAAVSTLPAPSGPADDAKRPSAALRRRLEEIALQHGGLVPLHGRLFAQWLHYTFPRECPFPHKAGSFAAHTLTPTEFGQEYFATKEEMTRHADQEGTVGEGDGDHMGQWSAEEELFADYSSHLVAPWERRSGMSYFLLLIVGVVAVLAFAKPGQGKGSAMDFSGVSKAMQSSVSSMSRGLAAEKPHMV